MSLTILGINHRTAPVSVREKVAFGPEQLPRALKQTRELPGVREALIVSTCNRTELYCEVEDGGDKQLRDWLMEFHALPGEALESLFVIRDHAAIEHTFNVASGLESAILGEPQILGQMKQAYRDAHDAGSTGPVLNGLFQHAFTVAKQVRTDTEIGTSPVSVAYAAVSLARQIFAGFERHSALLIGAGQTIELAARHLHGHGMNRIIIANRNVHRARELATSVDGFAISLDEIPAHLSESDIVISSTASPVPLVFKDMVEAALKKRRHRPMFMVDIAVPRDIEESVGELSDIYLYTVDDLHNVVQENMKTRQAAAQQAREIISAEVTRYQLAQKTLDAVPTIQELRRRAEKIRDQVLAHSLKELNAGKPMEQVLEKLATQLTNKLIHQPVIELRSAGEDGNTDLIRAVREAFGLGRGSK
jgi:glutamyl-tRNA reductase